MKRHVLLSVEGPHDEAVVGRLLRTLHGLNRVLNLEDLDALWLKLVPTQYPVKDLVARHPVPAFYTGANVTVAVLLGDGSEWSQKLGDSLDVLSPSPSAVGVLVDADKDAAKSLKDAQVKLGTCTLAPGAHGEVVRGAIDCRGVRRP